MLKNYLVVLLLLLLIPPILYAQQSNGEALPIPQEGDPIRCYTVEYEEYLKTQHPNRSSIEEFEEWMSIAREELEEQRTSNRTEPEIFTIPIIVHIIHRGEAVGEGTNIAADLVYAQIDQLNFDFRKTEGTLGFSEYVDAADTQIEFCPAIYDEMDNLLAEPGINRINALTHVPPLGAGVYSGIVEFDDVVKRQTFWNPDDYMNFWSADLGAVLLGYAQFPEAPCLEGIGTNNGDAETDGVVCTYTSIGGEDNPGSSENFGLGRTATHEVGHWLGLRHIWGDGNCTASDFCEDTPNAADSSSGCPTNNNTCDDSTNPYFGGANPRDMVENYMDYSRDNCMNIFTNVQRDRMRIVMGELLGRDCEGGSPRRAILTSSTKCGTIVTPVPTISFVKTSSTETETTECDVQTIRIPLQISTAPNTLVTVTANVTGGTATENTDFAFQTNPVIFPVGLTSTQAIEINIFNDGFVEATETIELDFSIMPGSNAEIASTNTTHTVNLLDDDLTPLNGKNTTGTLIYSEDFEGANAGSDWNQTQNNPLSTATWTVGDAENVFADRGLTTQSAYVSTPALGYQYEQGSVNNIRFESPVIDATGVSDMQLTFDFLVAGEGGGTDYDYGSLWYSTDGSSWTKFGINLFDFPLPATRTFDLPIAANNSATLQIAFQWQNDQTIANNPPLSFDNVLLTGTILGPSEISVTAGKNDEVDVFSNQITYFFDDEKNVLAAIENASEDLNCIQVNILTNGNETNLNTPLIHNDIHIASKTIQISPENNSGSYTISLYFTEAEINAWIAGQGGTVDIDDFRIFKTSAASVAQATPTNTEIDFTTTRFPYNANGVNGYRFEAEFTGFSIFGGGNIDVDNDNDGTLSLNDPDDNDPCVPAHTGTITINNPGNQANCDSYTLPTITGTNLTGNEAYYDDSQANEGSPITGPITENTTVYIYDAASPLCFAEESFMVTITNSPAIDNPGNQIVCDEYPLPAITGTNLSGGQAYYDNSQASGMANAISGPITSNQTVYIFDNNGGCESEISFTVTINNTPELDNPGNQIVCDGYQLPEITGTNLTGNEGYFTASGGMGTPLAEGAMVNTTQTIYIYDATGTNPNCTDEVSFELTVNNTPSIDNPGDQEHCDVYMLPEITGTNLTGNEGYFTAPNGGGSPLFEGQMLMSSQTVYIYDIVGSCSDQVSFEVTINDTPALDNPGNQTECDSYTLPAITGTNLTGGESYYTMSGGNGTPLAQGAMVTTTQTIYIYDATGTTPNCFDEVSFVVTINDTPALDNPGNQTECDSYTLPAITGTNLTGNESYYTQSGGMGTPLAEGQNITSTQTLYIYDAAGACTNEVSFEVTINDTPALNNPGNQTVCDGYELPAITGTNLTGNESYYTQSGGNGSMLNVGQNITTTQTIYIYDATGTTPNCSDEVSFTVTVNATPVLNNPGDQTHCDSYTLPAISGNNLSGFESYYNNSQASGSASPISGTITTSQTVYIYDANGSCSDEESFVVTINNTPAIDNPGDKTVCDSYTLPAITGTNLTGGESYYTQSGGNGSTLAVGSDISSTQTIYIYDATGTTPNCSDEVSFTVTVNNTPAIDNPGNQTECDNYTLPAISGTNLTGNEAYYTLAGGNGTALAAGQNITSTTTLYIFDEKATTPNCSDEVTFTVTINDTPVLDPRNDITSCGDYTLPAITGNNLSGNEAYYTMPDGNGTMYMPGQVISSNTTLFIFDQTGTTPNCFDEESFSITIGGSQNITPPTPGPQCGSYTFPAVMGTGLTGNEAYFTETGGGGTRYEPGETISTEGTQTIYIFDPAGTPPCNTEESFSLTINPAPEVNDLNDQVVCDSYTLPTINGTGLSGNEAYYTMSGGNGTMYEAGEEISSSTTLYIYDIVGACSDEQSFDITIIDSPVITNPGNQTACDSYTLPTIMGNNLSGNQAYYNNSQASGTAMPITESITATTTVYIYDETGTSPNCSDEVSFMVTINKTPKIDIPDNVTACDSYTLPAITGNDLTSGESYYTMSGGNGMPLSEGQMVNNTQTLYIYDATGTSPNCTHEVSFNLTIIDSPVLDNPGDQTACDSYTLPTIMGNNLNSPQYFDNSQANNGSPISGAITQTMTVYIYDAAGSCSDEEMFEVTINTTPSLDNPDNQTVCDSYTLPAISGADLTGNQSYYTASGGMGMALSAGQEITSTQTIYIYDATGTNPNCSDEVSFLVTVNNTPSITNPGSQSACDTYTLPEITGTNLTGNEGYFTASGGNGMQLSEGQSISNTQTIYIYDAVGSCMDEESFEVTINTTPSLDNPGNQTVCDSYTLPEITGDNLTGNEAYYTEAGGNGTPISGDITETTLVYIYDATGTNPNCSDEVSFLVTVNHTPALDNPGNQTVCDSYTLPEITGDNLTGNEAYYSASGGMGATVNGPITETTTLYIYDIDGSCSDEVSFTVTVNNTPAIDNPGNQTVCDSYTLPAITGENLTANAGYFTASGGNGTALNAGEDITSTQTIYIYDATGTSPNCTDEVSFEVTVIASPELDNPGDQTACDSYTLPNISGSNLNNPQYYNNSQASGGTLISGAITATTTVYIYDARGNCSDEESFVVTINDSPVLDNPGDQTACDSYTLPTINGENLTGNEAYYAAAGGNSPIAGPITETTTVYIYDATGTNPNCSDEVSFLVTINQTPALDNPGNQTVCDSYTLPEITGTNLNNPQYYSNSQANGGEVVAGEITSTMTVYIYDAEGDCSDEQSFMVTVNNSPDIFNSGPITVCDSYTLPEITGTNLVNPQYYDDSQANGGMSLSGPITETTVVYMYDETGTSPNCFEEEFFTVSINFVEAGSVSGDQNIGVGQDPEPFTVDEAASGAGIISYQWQKSTDNSVFLPIDGATMATYDEGTLDETTYFRRITSSTLNGVDCNEFTNTITVTVQPLPIDWLYFKGNLVNRTTHLEWATATEINAAIFEIEWSTDNKEWGNIRSIAANNEASIYNFIHDNPAIGNNYYRILQKDKNGESSYSNIVIVALEKEAVLEVNLQPNPATDRVTIDFENAAQNVVQLTITTLDGKLVKTQKLDLTQFNRFELDIADLPKGIYLVRANDAVTQFVEKLVVY